jgi:hypothetical protein
MTFHEAQVFNVAQTYVLPLLKGKAEEKVRCVGMVEVQMVTYTVSAWALFWLTSSSRNLISITRLVQSLRASRFIRYKAIRLNFKG